MHRVCVNNVRRSRRTLDKTVPPRTSVHVSYLRSQQMELLIANERALQRQRLTLRSSQTQSCTHYCVCRRFDQTFCRRFGVAVLTMNLSAVVLRQCRCSAHYKPTNVYSVLLKDLLIYWLIYCTLLLQLGLTVNVFSKENVSKRCIF